MVKQYQWRTAVTTGGTGEIIGNGFTPNTYTNWQTDDAGQHEEITIDYWWWDSNNLAGFAANRSTGHVVISQSWDVSINSKNQLSVTVRSYLKRVYRNEIVGNPIATPGRRIRISNYEGGTVYYDYTDDNIAQVKEIFNGNQSLGDTTIVLEPGTDEQRSVLFLSNLALTQSMNSEDKLWIGVQFKNILPPDYRPGASFNGSLWKSHNRTNGACHIYTGSDYKELRTVGGAEGEKGNPPLIATSGSADSWRNQKLLGQE